MGGEWLGVDIVQAWLQAYGPPGPVASGGVGLSSHPAVSSPCAQPLWLGWPPPAMHRPCFLHCRAALWPCQPSLHLEGSSGREGSDSELGQQEAAPSPSKLRARQRTRDSQAGLQLVQQVMSGGRWLEAACGVGQDLGTVLSSHSKWGQALQTRPFLAASVGSSAVSMFRTCSLKRE